MNVGIKVKVTIVCVALVDVCKDKSVADIEPLKPASLEEYDLDKSGKVTLSSRSTFHAVGQMPLYKTLVTSLGELQLLSGTWCKTFVNLIRLLIFVFVMYRR